jgi:glycerophosphoryl diester phosphodiesterase
VADGFLDYAPPLAFAHRGGAARSPENSWRAFSDAVRLGYAYLETDARATADGQVVAFHDPTLDRVCLTSFSGRRLAAARRALDRPVCLAAAPAALALVYSGLPAAALGARLAARWIRCAQVPVPVATPWFTRRAHAAGLQVHVWTVNDAQVMSRLLDGGADGIMTDETDALREVLSARGSWPPRPRP